MLGMGVVFFLSCYVHVSTLQTHPSYHLHPEIACDPTGGPKRPGRNRGSR